MTVQTARRIWRDNKTEYVPASGLNNPDLPEIRAWGTWLESLANIGIQSGIFGYTTRAFLYADLNHDANTLAWVTGDVNPSYNGVYLKVGASGSGSWSWVLPLPYSFIHTSPDAGSTANSIRAVSSIAVPDADGAALVAVSVPITNTSTTVMVEINGDSSGFPPLRLKTNSGNDPAIGGVVAGSILLGMKFDDTFRLFSDQASAAIIAQAESILAAIQAIVAGFEDYTTVNTTVTAGSMDTITLDNPAVVKDQIWLYVGGLYQYRSTYNVAGGVISPNVAWPGTGVELNVEVGYVPAFVTPVVANAIERVNVNTKFGKGMPITPFEFNANPDGVTDNTAAMVAWRDACEDDGLLPSLPRGIYSCSQNLDFSFGARIVGAGEGLTRVRITHPSGGFTCQPDINSDPYCSFGLEKLDIETTVIAALAINIILPNDGDFTNNFRVEMSNVDIYGINGGYFQKGLYERNVSYAERRRMRYWGSDQNPTADSGYYAGIAFDLDTQAVADNPALGLSLENLFTGLSAHFCNTGLRIRNFTEGVHLLNSNMAFVRRGVDAQAPVGTRQPLVSVIGGHFNASEYCVKLDGFNQSQILGVHMSRPGGEYTYGWTGAHLLNSLNTDIFGGKILTEAVATASVGDMIGVRLNGDSWYSRINTAFIGAISGGFKPMTTAVHIESGVNGTKRSPSITYSGTITNSVVDLSGNDTNVVATGMTFREGATLKSPVGGGTEIAFAAANFDVTQAGSAISVAAA